MSLVGNNEVLKLVGKTLDDFSVHMPFCFGTRDENEPTCDLVNLECEYAHACNSLVNKMWEDPEVEKLVFKRYRKVGQAEGYSDVDLTAEIERVKDMGIQRKAAKKVEEPEVDEFADLDLDDLSDDTPDELEDFDEPTEDKELGASDVEGFDEPEEPSTPKSKPVPEEIEGDEISEGEDLDIEGFTEIEEEEEEEEPVPEKKRRGRKPKEKPAPAPATPKKAPRVLITDEEIEEPEDEEPEDEEPVATKPVKSLILSKTLPEKPKVQREFAVDKLVLDAVILRSDGSEENVKIQLPLHSSKIEVSVRTSTTSTTSPRTSTGEKPSSEEFITEFIGDLGSDAEFTVDFFISSSKEKGFNFSEAGAKNVLSRYSKKHGGYSINKEDWTYVVGG